MTRHEQHQRTWAVHICINLAVYVSIGLPHDRAHAQRSMLMCGCGAGVDVGRHDTLVWGCVGCVGTHIALTCGDVGAGGVGTGIGRWGLLTCGHVGGRVCGWVALLVLVSCSAAHLAVLAVRHAACRAAHHAACRAVRCVVWHARCCLHPAGSLHSQVVGLDSVLHPCRFRYLRPWFHWGHQPGGIG